ncbi:hypothetical protein Taro_021348, partial [Colocasia esculenta]|nr:hypothetical protein [Colocasia esculenta]
MAPKAKEKTRQPPAPAVSKAAAAAPPPAVAVEDLFTTLHRHIQATEYVEAAKVADQVLAAAPGDEDALRCKVVALIKADAIDRALSAIQAASAQGFQIDLRFYK